MKPILYESTETTFATNGLGRLWDATEASVVEELNGEYTLTVSCPVYGKHLDDLKKGRILLAKPNDVDQAQPFRITGIHKTLGGGVTVTARHISYDTRKIVVTPISVVNLGQFISTLPSKLVTTSGFTSFTISSDVSRSATFYREEPVTLRSLLSADDTSIPTVYGVEAKYDRFSIVFKARRGADNGVGMRYGKNLVSLETDESEDDVYATILPYYKDNEGGCVYGSLCTATGYTATGAGAVPVDVSSYLTAGQSTLDETWYPTQAAVTAAGAQWLAENKPYIPQRQISATPAELSGINTVELGDTVHVFYPALDITEEYRIARLTYDVLMERVSGVDLMLNNLSGGVVVKPMVWQGQMSGVASAMKTETDKLEKKVSEAKDLSSQLANGTYKGGSFMDDDNVYAPHIWGGATLNVGARNDPTPIGPSGSVAGKYNFNVDSNGSLRIGPMSAASQEEASLEEDESSSSGSESKDPSVVYKFDFDAAENVLSLHGNYAVHNSAGTKIGYMGRITGSAGDSGSTEGVAFTVGNNPQSVTDDNDSFFLATSGGARLNYKGNKVYASGSYVKMEHKDDVSVTLGSTLGSGWISLKYGQGGPSVLVSSSAITLEAGGHNITIDSTGARYDGDEIKT